MEDEQEPNRSFGQQRHSTPAMLAVKHTQQRIKHHSSQRPAPTKPNGGGVRYRPAAHSPERQSGPHDADNHGLAQVAATEDQWLPEIPVRNDIIRNKHGQRLDRPLPRPSRAEFDTYRSRSRQYYGNLCNEHHLSGSCTYKNGAESGLVPPHACVYDHSPINGTLLRVLLYLSRTKPCPYGSECVDFGCFSGHHCTPEVHSFKGHGQKLRCPWAGISIQDNEPDATKTIHVQPADAVVRSQPREQESEPEQKVEEANLLVDDEVW